MRYYSIITLLLQKSPSKRSSFTLDLTNNKESDMLNSPVYPQFCPQRQMIPVPSNQTPSSSLTELWLECCLTRWLTPAVIRGTSCSVTWCIQGLFVIHKHCVPILFSALLLSDLDSMESDAVISKSLLYWELLTVLFCRVVSSHKVKPTDKNIEYVFKQTPLVRFSSLYQYVQLCVTFGYFLHNDRKLKCSSKVKVPQNVT